MDFLKQQVWSFRACTRFEMCRFLAVHDSKPFLISGQLRQLALISQNSSEYQGDGWGCVWHEEGRWRLYKNSRPIWEDDLNQFGHTTLLLAHARSAFRNEELDVANNMPYVNGSNVFVFNGELHGVKLREQGRIGAEKLFNFLQRFEARDQYEGIRKAVGILKRRTRYVKAMNFIMTARESLYVHACFNEAADYFTLYKKRSGTRFAICSEQFRDDSGWVPMPNNYLEAFQF